jgi:hypothetical protein
MIELELKLGRVDLQGILKGGDVEMYPGRRCRIETFVAKASRKCHFGEVVRHLERRKEHAGMRKLGNSEAKTLGSI